MQTRFFSADPDTRRAEWLLLGYSPLWMAAVLLLLVSGAFSGWSEPAFMLFGTGLALPLWLMPLLPPRNGYLGRAMVFVTLLSFLQNYFGTAFFFRTLGMEYHFHTRLLWNGAPLFLYPLTVAYFATYFVLMQVLWRAVRTHSPRPSRITVLLTQALLSYAMAFGETYFMANDMLKGAFSYADRHRTLIYGSFCYGTLFFITLPLFYRISEERRSMRQVIWDVLAANSLILVCYEVYGYLMEGR